MVGEWTMAQTSSIPSINTEYTESINDTILSANDLKFVPQLYESEDIIAVRTYTIMYTYDLQGNLTALNHLFKPQSSFGNDWTCAYPYTYQDDLHLCKDLFAAISYQPCSLIAGRVKTEFIRSFTPYLENQVMSAWANAENVWNIRRI